MRFFRFFLCATAACVASLALAPTARAQSCSPAGSTVSGIAGTVLRVGDGTIPLPPHPSPAGAAVPVNAINYSDCVNDESLQIAVNVPISSQNNLEVWAGPQDCGSLAARTVATQVCWPVSATQQASQRIMTLNVKARDIAAFINTGTAGGLPSLYSAAQPESVCDTAQTGDAATTINLYIFIADGTGNVCGSEITYAVTVDLRAGTPATTPTASAGDGQIYVSIPGTTDSDIKYWNVYTNPPPNGGPQADAGPLPICDAAVPIADASGDDADSASDTGATTPIDLGDAATDADTDGGEVSDVADAAITCTAVPQIDGGSAAASSSTACPTSQILVSGGGTTSTDEEGGTVTVGGKQVLVPDQYLGAQVGVSSTKATVSGLTNDTTYTVAVAGVDQVGNVGPLQLVTVCGAATTPDPTGNFWGNYYTDGGRAGGFCTLEAVGAPAGSATAGFLMLGAFTGLARRARRRRAKKEGT